MTGGFIETAPQSIVLTPREKVAAPAGGFVWQDGTPRPPQVFRVSYPPAGDAAATLRGTDGQERHLFLILVGDPDAAVGLWDRFTLDGHGCEVAQLLYRNGFEVRADVIRHG